MDAQVHEAELVERGGRIRALRRERRALLNVDPPPDDVPARLVELRRRLDREYYALRKLKRKAQQKLFSEES